MKEQESMVVFPDGISPWEFEKISYIFKAVRERLGFELWHKGTQFGVNPNSGYSWVWSEDYPASFYMPINCELQPDQVYALWTNPENGDEQECELIHFNNDEDFYAWIEEQERSAEVG